MPELQGPPSPTGSHPEPAHRETEPVETTSGGVTSDRDTHEPKTIDPEPPIAPSTDASLTAPSSRIEPDVWTDDDEAYGESTNTSYLSSIASDVRRGIVENGRTYGVYGITKSWIPSDDLEMDRNDLQHCKFTMLMNDELHLAPMPEFPQKILDLGTGSGIWAMDIADQHPSASVIGVDKIAVQPNMIPNNLTFELDDIEDDWLWGESSFDFIHGRELIMAIQDWPRLIRQAHEHLKPGAYLQLSGSIPDFRSDDGTLPADSAYVEMGRIYFEMSERVRLSGWEPTNWKRYLEEAGFEDVVERVLKIPTNPWPRDPHLKKIGAFELHHFRESIANVFARGYEQILGGDPVYFQVLLAKARKEVSNPNMHSWVPFYVVYGRRSGNSTTSIHTEHEKSASPPEA
ncbi:S-adenosyl-L-methionine-dependent methyltransferase [Dactylonectria estremocensis]|uniref:S-adenosyl-L-methionine-dependent methyltransferase n=1 Tax=Dactylonectria estremocensis TaxID=1079267 RepID=A0A9P9DM98_9HYPO|nr:S-adenosyl-L-methionine-dependent methyltransferase [Dactylonectria estremocensis]